MSNASVKNRTNVRVISFAVTAAALAGCASPIPATPRHAACGHRQILVCERFVALERCDCAAVDADTWPAALAAPAWSFAQP
jgi:hypothetical protein